MTVFSIESGSTLRAAAPEYGCWDCPEVWGYQYPWQCPF